jgi:hypothetical protein
MAKNFKNKIDNTLSPTKKGMENVFSPTTTESPLPPMVRQGSPTEGDNVSAALNNRETVVKETAGDIPATLNNQLPKAAPKTSDVSVFYNLKYSKELQKKIKMFCIEHDGIDMKDVFTQGAIMYMETYKTN